MNEPAAQTVGLLQAMIRNRCVNDGKAESGQEIRNVETLRSFLDGAGIDLQVYEPLPGRASLVARIEGSDPSAPSLCLMGHTDVVPVDPDGWSRDPFAGELVGGEVWGRGAIDMLNLTASMAVAFRQLAGSGFRPRGDLIYFAVADEESGGAHGMRWMADNERDVISADYVLTESGGISSGPSGSPRITVRVAEKGLAWRRLRVLGTPGHGSTPFKANNALTTAAAVISRLHEYQPAARLHELWPEMVSRVPLPDDVKSALLDPGAVDSALESMPRAGYGPLLHACTHTTFSCNAISGGSSPMKVNVIPGTVDVLLDIRTLPGETPADVDAHLRAALGDLYDRVDVEVLLDDAASTSTADTPLWDALARASRKSFPGARLSPDLGVGSTDARTYREMGAVAYGAALLSPHIDAAEFRRRFHGNDERIDVESLALTTDLWLNVVHDMLG